MEKVKTIRVTVQADGDDMSLSEQTQAAAVVVFERHPDALYVGTPRYYSRLENRDGVPFPVSLVSLEVAFPVDAE